MKTNLFIGMTLVALMAATSQAVDLKSPNFETPALESYYSGQAALGQAKAAQIQAQAAMIKAAGDVATSNVKAAESLESARGKVIDNGVKSASIFFDKKKVFESFQAASAPQRASQEDVARYNRSNLPRRASASQVDPLHNTIRWPEILQDESFKEARAQLDSLYARRNTEAVGPGSELIREGREAAGALRATLREKMSELSSAEYMAARKFINALEYEIQLPPRAEGMAAANQ